MPTAFLASLFLYFTFLCLRRFNVSRFTFLVQRLKFLRLTPFQWLRRFTFLCLRRFNVSRFMFLVQRLKFLWLRRFKFHVSVASPFLSFKFLWLTPFLVSRFTFLVSMVGASWRAATVRVSGGQSSMFKGASVASPFLRRNELRLYRGDEAFLCLRRF